MENGNNGLVDRVQAALTQIRPFLEADGGDISLVEITKDMEAVVEFHGACSSCSMSAMTLKAGVEESIRKSVPEIISVKALSVSASI